MDARPHSGHDEAGRIRRFSPGPSQQSDHGSNSAAHASIGGGFWVVLFAIALAAVAGVVMVQSAIGAARAAERAEKAERAATLAREYAVAAFYQTQAEWAKRGVELPSILGHHDPAPNEAYEQFDNYVESRE